MKKRVISSVLRGQDPCLFCAFSPRTTTRLQTSRLHRQLRSISSNPIRAQSQVAAKREDEDEGFSMLKQNASLSSSFPSRTKPKPSHVPATPVPSEADRPRSQSNHRSAGSSQPVSEPSPGGLRIRYSSAPDRSAPPPRRKNSQGGSDSREQRPYRPTRNRESTSNTQSGVVEGGLRISRSYTDRQPDYRPHQATLGEAAPFGSRDRRFRSGYNQERPQQQESHRSEESRSGGQSFAGVREQQPLEQKVNTTFSPFRISDDLGTQASSRHDREYDEEIAPRRDYRGRNGLDRGAPLRSGTAAKRDFRPNNVDNAATEDVTEVDTIVAPAGSSFDSELDEGHHRLSWDKKPRRSDRFAIEDDIDEPVPNLPRSRARVVPKAFDFEMAEAEEMLYGHGGRKKKGKNQKQVKNAEEFRPAIQLPEFISVERLARLLKVTTDQLVQKLEEEGYEGARYDHVLDSGTSAMFADLYGFEPTIAGPELNQDLVARPPAEDQTILPSRPPIVTIMGHVDHGKTTILDYLRKSSVVATEHGGITQHIGAFSVTMPGTNRQITFLDTPGHAAFLEMRRRGANVTDIVILVVAADDSVKPQTIEAIKHALEAQVQLIVAINKVDKSDADVERVKQDLTRHDIVVEDYGGDYQAIPVSGKTGQGMAELEEAIITLADVSDFRAETDGPAEGWVLESKVTPAGRVATILVRRGTLRTGDFIVAGTTWARVRTLRNDAGALVTEAPPGMPVQVDGWRAGDPSAGLEVLQAEDETHAKDVVDIRLQQEETSKAATDLTALNTTKTEEAEARAKVLSWEAEQEWAKKRFGQRPKDNEGWVEVEKASGIKRVPFVIKADVAGSVEAVVAAVTAIGNNEINANIIHSAVGELVESDIRRLAATGETGFAINFNQPVDGSIARLAEASNLHILNHNIIYKVTDDVKERLAAELPPIITQRVHGEAEVGQVFEVTIKRNKVKIAGCRITNGTISRANKVRVVRNGQTVYTGALHSLKNVKKDVTEMRKGAECGMGFEDWEDFEAGDQVQCFEEIEEKRTLY